MGGPRQELWRAARDPRFLVLSIAVALSLVRSADQPSFDLSLAGTEVAFVPTDLALAALAVLVVLHLAGSGSLPRPARSVAIAAAAFSAWLLLSSAANGSEALVAAAKLLEYGVLALGVVLFVRRRIQLWLLTGVLVAVTAVAGLWGLLAFFDLPPADGEFPWRRQPSFLGEHDLAALGTMSLALGLAALYAPRHRLGRVFPLVATVAGGVGVVLGAALASVLGLYLCAAAIAGLAVARGAATRRALALTAVVLVAVTAGVLALRSGDLAAFGRFLGVAERSESQDENAASWSQRLIYVYVGGRIFLDQPVLGTGWHGTLPADEFVEYLPDARDRFPDQPDRYFPTAETGFIPQQTYDQVLYELGVVGAALFAALVVVTAAAALGVARRWPRGDPDEPAAYLPAAWVAALLGGLAGAALFGGIPLAAIFWLTLGVAALAPSLVPARPLPPAPAERRIPAGATA
jgi:hypothetical protein